MQPTAWDLVPYKYVQACMGPRVAKSAVTGSAQPYRLHTLAHACLRMLGQLVSIFPVVSRVRGRFEGKQISEYVIIEPNHEREKVSSKI